MSFVRAVICPVFIWLFILLVANSACRGPEISSSVKFYNGIDAKHNYPQVFSLEIEIRDPSSGKIKDINFCSSVAVQENALLTAAHCFCLEEKKEIASNENDMNNQNNEIAITFSNGKITQKKDFLDLKIHSQFNCQQEEPNPFDLAMVLYPSDVRFPFLEIDSTPLSFGQKVFMAGYGYTDYEEDLNNRNYGSNTFSDGILAREAKKNGLILIKGWEIDDEFVLPATQVSGAGGDSGGPLLLNNKVVGILSSSGPFAGLEISVFVDLSSPASQSFLLNLK